MCTRAIPYWRARFWPIRLKSLFGMKQKLSLAFAIASLLAGVTACVKSEKSSNPLGPSVAGPIPGVGITEPNPIGPAQGARIPVEQQPLTLLVGNATTSGVRPLSYLFEVASDVNFTNKIFVRESIAPGANGRTELRLPDPLAAERDYYWRARAQDGANTGNFSFPVVFRIFTPIVLGAPRLLAPVGQLSDLTPRYSVANAPRSGPTGPIRYVIELATDFAFGNKLAIWQIDEQPGQTNLDSPGGLPSNRQFYWRAQATNGGISGPWSEVESFSTPNVTLPTGPPAPGAACGPPYPSTELGVSQCRRSQYRSNMSSSEFVAFLRGLASDLNAGGFPYAPNYGILQKPDGNNCNGYSCDIICVGQGNGQLQWDVLIDDGRQAGWSGPLGTIVPRICEVVQ